MNTVIVMGFIQIAIGALMVIGGINFKESERKLKNNIAKAVSPAHFEAQSFSTSLGMLEDAKGNRVFYPKKDVDEWITKLNKELAK